MLSHFFRGVIYCVFFRKLAMTMQQCFSMHKGHAPKGGTVICCSMPSNLIGINLCAEKDRVEVELVGNTIGVADYQLIVPKDKLQKVLADEIKAFSEEKKNKNF